MTRRRLDRSLGLKPGVILELYAALKRRSSTVFHALISSLRKLGSSSLRYFSVLLKSRKPRGDGVAVEIESDGSVEIGAVDVDSGGLQALQDLGLREAERGSEADRDHGETWLYGLPEFPAWWRWRCRDVQPLTDRHAGWCRLAMRRSTAFSASPSSSTEVSP